MPNLIAILLISSMLSGCTDVLDVFLTVPERFNKAFPPGVDVRLAEENLRVLYQNDNSELKSFEKQYASKLVLRSIDCMEGHEIGRFDTVRVIRKLPVSYDCLNLHDAQLLQYLGARQVALRLSQTPLRRFSQLGLPVLMKATGDSEISSVIAAQESSVAVLRTKGGEYITAEIPGGNIIVTLPKLLNITNARLSPNGRIVAFSTQKDGMNFVDTETGAKLWASIDIGGIDGWLPSIGAALVSDRKSRRLGLVDFKSGQIITHAGDYQDLPWVISAGNSPAHALVGSHEYFTLNTYIREPEGIKVSVIKEYSTKQRRGNASSRATLMRDGKAIVFVSSDYISIFDLASEDEEFLETGGFLAKRYAKLSETTLLVDSYNYKDRSTRPWVFDIERQTLSPIEAGESNTGLLFELDGRIGFVRSNSRGTWIGDQVKSSKPELLDKIISTLKTERQISQLESGVFPSKTVPTTSVLGGASIERSVFDENRGDKSTAAENISRTNPDDHLNINIEKYDGLQLHVIGVYEGPVHFGRIMSDPSASRIKVRVHSSNKPIVLVLCSYEAVQWDISASTGANISEIILESAHGATVSGIDEKAVRVLRKTLGCSYKNDAAKVLKQMTGLNIVSFQGLYRGTEFSVGP